MELTSILTMIGPQSAALIVVVVLFLRAQQRRDMIINEWSTRARENDQLIADVVRENTRALGENAEVQRQVRELLSKLNGSRA